MLQSMRPPESNQETSGFEPLSHTFAGPSRVDSIVPNCGAEGIGVPRKLRTYHLPIYRSPRARLARAARLPVLSSVWSCTTFANRGTSPSLAVAWGFNVPCLPTMELVEGFDPPTLGVQNRCSTN